MTDRKATTIVDLRDIRLIRERVQDAAAALYVVEFSARTGVPLGLVTDEEIKARATEVRFALQEAGRECRSALRTLDLLVHPELYE